MSDFIQIIILALIQGITEFLPISSSAHLQLPALLLGWQDRGLAFDVAVHFGSLIAVIFYFRVQVGQIINGLWLQCKGQRSVDGDLGIALIVATIPACVVGLWATDFIELQLRNIATISVATLLGAFLLWYADTRGAQRTSLKIGLGVALILGCAQAFALIPGMSRSGIVLTTALLLGYHRFTASQFSFLMSIPIISLGAFYQLLKLLLATDITAVWWHFGLAIIVSGLSAWLCITLFLGYVQRSSLLPFISYRIALGLLLMWIWLG